MDTQYTLNDLTRALAQTPRVKRAKADRIKSICGAGAMDVEYEMERRKLLRQHVRKQAGIAFVTKLERHHLETHATVPVTYSLRSPELYFYSRDIAFYANAYARKVITVGEWKEYVHNVKLMGKEGGIT